MVDDSHSYPSRIEGIESVRNWAQKSHRDMEGSGLNLGLLFFPCDEKTGGRWWEHCFRS